MLQHSVPEDCILWEGPTLDRGSSVGRKEWQGQHVMH